MAELLGVNPDATRGEIIVANALKKYLPKEWTVYYELAIRTSRDTKYPDFVVLTDYGVVVLEVKDWRSFDTCDQYEITLSDLGKGKKQEKNPIRQVKNYADKLRSMIASESNQLTQEEKDIPAGYCVVLPLMQTSIVSRLKTVWQDNRVLSAADLQPDIILKSLRNTIPDYRIHSLSSGVISKIRGVINPRLYIETGDHESALLDEKQESIILEPIREQVIPVSVQETHKQTEMFFSDVNIPEPVSTNTDEETPILPSMAIRLIRGIAGSGKTLVLMQRARYLKDVYPDWKILVLTFNKKLSEQLRISLKDDGIQVNHFHQICAEGAKKILRIDIDASLISGFLQKTQQNHPVLARLNRQDIAEEIHWMQEMQINEKSRYLQMQRKGRGSLRLTPTLREEIFDWGQEYLAYLEKSGKIDWEYLPLLYNQLISSGKIKPDQFDAILIDEAQDFAPVWISTIKKFLKPNGLFFLTDDPSQSIFRFFSWKEKGIEVVGRTRWLNIPYRNTKQIFSASYSLVDNDRILKASLEKEGGYSIPDINHPSMRIGPKPRLGKFKNIDQEARYIQSAIQNLRQQGTKLGEIVVLHPRKREADRIRNIINMSDLLCDTIQSFKGLEFDYVFLCGIDQIFEGASGEEDISIARRLLYMSMTRARKELMMSYTIRMPEPFKCILPFVDEFIG